MSYDHQEARARVPLPFGIDCDYCTAEASILALVMLGNGEQETFFRCVPCFFHGKESLLAGSLDYVFYKLKPYKDAIARRDAAKDRRRKK